MSLVIGTWLMLSPLVLDYGAGARWLNPLVAGAVVTVLAAMRISGLWWMAGLSVVNAAIGGWMLLSAFWLTDSTAASWKAGACGLAVMLFAILSAAATEEAKTAAPRAGRRGDPAM